MYYSSQYNYNKQEVGDNTVSVIKQKITTKIMKIKILDKLTL